MRAIKITLFCWALSGCGGPPPVVGDGGSPDAAPGIDASACISGSACGDGRICVSGACIASICGDGVVDSRTEDCDDGNNLPFDGCEPSDSATPCRFTCVDAASCDDNNLCNGAERCNTSTHLCEGGAIADPGTACMIDASSAGVCRAGVCVTAGCGNMIVEAGEDCDDGNDIADDGCTIECFYTCSVERPCTDGDACNGEELCQTDHTCSVGTPVVCDDGSPCTTDSCTASDGTCVFTLIDEDADGFASLDLGACGMDCDDSRADVCPSDTQCPEQCDLIDHDCDGDPVPADAPVWYRDCDGDTYAEAGAPSSPRMCDPPAPATCGGGWTTRVPLATVRDSLDCNDGNTDVHPVNASFFSAAIAGVPTSRDYDYDCDGVEERRYTDLWSGCRLDPGGTSCSGTAGWTGTTVPVCGGTGDYQACGYRAGRCVIALSRDRRQTCQ
jgi:cysteine-rich repeat protein